MKIREIFRYTNSGYNYIASVSEYEEFIPPKEYGDSVSYWIALAITKTSAKKNGRTVNRDDGHDGRFECNVENGVDIAFDLMELFRKWLNKDKPKFLTISAYKWDCPEKRLRIYKRFLNKEGYDLYFIEKVSSLEYIYQFCRSDLEFKRKVY